MIRLIKGAEVFSSVGEKIGLLDRVVLDPETKKVSHIIVTQGFLLSISKVIPISYVNLDGERITLTKNAMELADLPDFDESMYVSLERTGKPEEDVESIYWYPPHHLSWWTTGGRFWYPKPKFVKPEKTIPEGTVPLEEGAKVISKDGKHIGNVERVIVETSDELATHIIVSEGLVLKERKSIPTFWIAEVDDDKIKLSIESDLFEQLPDYEPVA
jgi:sporulation protein YlmC with PRC-barrel domain